MLWGTFLAFQPPPMPEGDIVTRIAHEMLASVVTERQCFGERACRSSMVTQVQTFSAAFRLVIGTANALQPYSPGPSDTAYRIQRGEHLYFAVNRDRQELCP